MVKRVPWKAMSQQTQEIESLLKTIIFPFGYVLNKGKFVNVER